MYVRDSLLSAGVRAESIVLQQPQTYRNQRDLGATYRDSKTQNTTERYTKRR